LRLVTFAPSPRDPARVGVLLPDGGVLDLGEEARLRGRALPFDTGDLVSLIASGEAGLRAVRELLAAPRSKGSALAGVRLLAPIPRPRKNVFCVGWNYLEHFKEGEAWRQT